MDGALIGIIMGSASDWETMRHAADTLRELGIANLHKDASPLYQKEKNAD